MRHQGRFDSPELSALFTLSFLVFFDVFGLICAISVAFGTDLVGFFMTSKLACILESFAFVAANYLYFLRGQRIETISKEFRRETQKERRSGTVFLSMFITLSLVLPFLAFISLGNMLLKGAR